MYSELIKRLFTINLKSGMKLGLQNALDLQKALHFPDRSFISIHVAGTNGKGSVATKIASAFEHAGYRTGLYTSPHIACFRERIRINGQMITEEKVETFLSLLFEIAEKQQILATFFELTTLMAFLHFAKEQADIAVIETGLGGRLDATTIITPCLSVITSISLDHTDLLGTTREEIAREKGGIIKVKIPVVIGPHVPLEPIQEIASQKQSLCIQSLAKPLLFEEENRSIARTALEYLSSTFSLSSKAIEQGLLGRQPCRLEKIPGPPLIILDVAHNPDGLQHLFQAIKHDYPDKSLRLLFGLSKTKDVQACLHLLAAHGDHFHLVEAPNGRGASPQVLSSNLEALGIDSSRLFMQESIHDGVHIAREEACRHNQILVICGSFFIMGQVRQALGFAEPMDTTDLNERGASAEKG